MRTFAYHETNPLSAFCLIPFTDGPLVAYYSALPVAVNYTLFKNATFYFSNKSQPILVIFGVTY